MGQNITTHNPDCTERRRVLQIIPSLSLGGTEKTAQLFATYLDKKRFNVLVWSPIDGPRHSFLKEANVPVYIGGSLEKILYHFKPHIAHIHRAGSPNVKQLSVFRGTEWFHNNNKFPKIVETNVFGQYDPSYSSRVIDKTLFVSHFCAQRFSALYNIPVNTNRYGILYNPIEASTIINNTIPPYEKDYSIPIIGRLSRADKGKWSIKFGLTTILFLLKKIPTIQYYIIGGIQEAYDFVLQHNLSQYVTFFPEIITELELAKYFNMLSVFVHANDFGESFGMSIAEAMAAGLPVVTHKNEGILDNAQVELVEDGTTGIIANTPEIYADSIAFLINNPSIAQQMGLAGQKKALNLFDAPIITKQLESIYDELYPVYL